MRGQGKTVQMQYNTMAKARILGLRLLRVRTQEARAKAGLQEVKAEGLDLELQA